MQGLTDRRVDRLEEFADRLVALYNQPFGGKPRGRYRISMKFVRQCLDQRRVWPEQIEALRRALYERGYQLIDMESFFVVVSQQTFTGYRRVNRASLEQTGDVPVAPFAGSDDDA